MSFYIFRMNFTPGCASIGEVWWPWQMLAHMIMAVSFSSPWDEQMNSTINTPSSARWIWETVVIYINISCGSMEILCLPHAWIQISNRSVNEYSTSCFFPTMPTAGHRRHGLQYAQIGRSWMWRWRKTLESPQDKNYWGIFLSSTTFLFAWQLYGVFDLSTDVKKRVVSSRCFTLLLMTLYLGKQGNPKRIKIKRTQRNHSRKPQSECLNFICLTECICGINITSDQT